MEIVSYIFISSLILIFYAYFGYPISLILLSFFRHKKIEYEPNYQPMITLIITAYNEEKRIGNKLENTVQLVYPKDKLQVIVVSDGSTDNTHAIVQSYRKHGVTLHITKERRGKENAQKEAIQFAQGEIIVFSDAATIIEPQGLNHIVAPFVNPDIGSVSSEDVFLNEDGSLSGEGAYVKYEMWLRKLESKVNSVVGLSGSFFAARKGILADFSGQMQSDFRTLLNCQRMGYYGISNPKAKGIYKNIKDEKNEYDRKVRTVLRGITVYFEHLELLNLFKYGIFSYQYFTHKLMRWLVPWFILTAIISNMILTFHENIYSVILFFQVLFYLFAIIGKTKNRISRILIFKLPYYFIQVNWGILISWIRYLKGERVVMWQPSDR